MSQGRYRVGFDVGGTFTDFAVQTPDGRLHDSALPSRRPVYFPEKGGYVDTPAFGRDERSAGAELAGAAVVGERESTTVLPPCCGARVDDHGSLLVEVSGAG